MKLLAIMAILSGAHSITVLNSKDVTGWVHGTMTVQCSYGTKNQLSNQVKYWCKGHNLLTCTILVRTDDSTTHDRISISDNKTEAMVSITMKDLQERDEGDYWCGVSLPGPDDAEQVHIKVNGRKDSKSTTWTPTATGSPERTGTTRTKSTLTSLSVSVTVPYNTFSTEEVRNNSVLTTLGACFGALLFLCCLTVPIAMKIKGKRTEEATMNNATPSGEAVDLTYTEVRSGNSTLPPSDSTYANVSLSQCPPTEESVVYSIVAR
uniref:Immunoglobulin domain-containing protein n=1 Tax=Lepisosteus oculatus TaxID=7918 RepID=W5N1F9_LEPOC